MIVIGVDVHKHSFTAVAVDGLGRMLDERTVSSGANELIVWASELDAERLWAVEDCRQLTRTVEHDLLAAGEDLVRVPPKLMAPERRTGRERGKSDPIDALAIARVAVRESRLSRPRPDEEIYRDIKLLVDHRDDLVDERRRMQQRLRWHLHQLDPTLAVPARMLGRASHLERVGRWLARQPEAVQVRVARELVARCRSMNKTITGLDLELEQRVEQTAPALLELPGCGAITAAKLLGDRPRRQVPNGRTARTPQRRRAPPSKLREGPTPPARPRRQPPTQRRPLPRRDHASPLPPRRPHLPRTQTSRRKKPPRSHPLPQTTPRPRRLQHVESEPPEPVKSNETLGRRY
jgi:transposase